MRPLEFHFAFIKIVLVEPLLLLLVVVVVRACVRACVQCPASQTAAPQVSWAHSGLPSPLRACSILETLVLVVLQKGAGWGVPAGIVKAVGVDSRGLKRKRRS